MGNQALAQQPSLITPPSTLQLVETLPTYNIWRLPAPSPSQTRHIQEYYVQMHDDRQYRKEKQLFLRRFNSDTLVASKYFRELPQTQLCSSLKKGLLFLERIPFRFHNLSPLTTSAQLLHVYGQCFRGFAELVDAVGTPFDVEANMIGVNQDGRVKAWMNSDFSDSCPSSSFANQYMQERDMIIKILQLVERKSMLPQNRSQDKGVYIKGEIQRTLQNIQPMTFRNCYTKVHAMSIAEHGVQPGRLQCSFRVLTDNLQKPNLHIRSSSRAVSPDRAGRDHSPTQIRSRSAGDYSGVITFQPPHKLLEHTNGPSKVQLPSLNQIFGQRHPTAALSTTPDRSIDPIPRSPIMTDPHKPMTTLAQHQNNFANTKNKFQFQQLAQRKDFELPPTRFGAAIRKAVARQLDGKSTAKTNGSHNLSHMSSAYKTYMNSGNPMEVNSPLTVQQQQQQPTTFRNIRTNIMHPHTSLIAMPHKTTKFNDGSFHGSAALQNKAVTIAYNRSMSYSNSMNFQAALTTQGPFSVTDSSIHKNYTHGHNLIPSEPRSAYPIRQNNFDVRSGFIHRSHSSDTIYKPTSRLANVNNSSRHQSPANTSSFDTLNSASVRNQDRNIVNTAIINKNFGFNKIVTQLTTTENIDRCKNRSDNNRSLDTNNNNNRVFAFGHQSPNISGINNYNQTIIPQSLIHANHNTTVLSLNHAHAQTGQPKIGHYESALLDPIEFDPTVYKNKQLVSTLLPFQKSSDFKIQHSLIAPAQYVQKPMTANKEYLYFHNFQYTQPLSKQPDGFSKPTHNNHRELNTINASTSLPDADGYTSPELLSMMQQTKQQLVYYNTKKNHHTKSVVTPFEVFEPTIQIQSQQQQSSVIMPISPATTSINIEDKHKTMPTTEQTIKPPKLKIGNLYEHVEESQSKSGSNTDRSDINQQSPSQQKNSHNNNNNMYYSNNSSKQNLATYLELRQHMIDLQIMQERDSLKKKLIMPAYGSGGVYSWESQFHNDGEFDEEE